MSFGFWSYYYWLANTDEVEPYSICPSKPYTKQGFNYVGPSIRDGFIHEKGCIHLAIPKSYLPQYGQQKITIVVGLPGLIPGASLSWNERRDYYNELEIEGVAFSSFEERIEHRKDARFGGRAVQMEKAEVYGLKVHQEFDSEYGVNHVVLYSIEPNKILVDCLVGEAKRVEEIKGHMPCKVTTELDPRRVWIIYRIRYSKMKAIDSTNTEVKTLIKSFIKN